MKTAEVKLGKKTYVITIMPKAEYLKLRKGEVPPNTVDAIAYARDLLAADLLAAREHADLTQEQLAERLGKSQTMIARAEAGNVSVGERYVAAVLKACGLPKDWKPPTKSEKRRIEGAKKGLEKATRILERERARPARAKKTPELA